MALDRWHLQRNLAEAFERHVSRHHATRAGTLRFGGVREGEQAIEAQTPEQAQMVGRLTIPPASEVTWRAERQAWRRARFDHVHGLNAAGRSKSEIARDTGLDGYTITTYLARDARRTSVVERAPPASSTRSRPT